MKYLAAFLLAPLLAVLAVVVYFHQHYTVMAAIQGEEWLIVSNARALDCAMQGGCIVFSPTELGRALARFSGREAPAQSPRSQGAPL